jgi:predicted  nucleic acid-binding Zn-ribbon protein
MSTDLAAERLTTAISRMEAVMTARFQAMQQELDRARQDAQADATSAATINGLTAEIDRLKSERDAQEQQLTSLKAAQSTDQTLAAENQRLRTALEEALANVDSILAELNGKI